MRKLDDVIVQPDGSTDCVDDKDLEVIVARLSQRQVDRCAITQGNSA